MVDIPLTYDLLHNSHDAAESIAAGTTWYSVWCRTGARRSLDADKASHQTAWSKQGIIGSLLTTLAVRGCRQGLDRAQSVHHNYTNLAVRCAGRPCATQT